MGLIDHGQQFNVLKLFNLQQYVLIKVLSMTYFQNPKPV